MCSNGTNPKQDQSNREVNSTPSNQEKAHNPQTAEKETKQPKYRSVSQISQISIGNNTGGIQNGATQEGESESKKHGKSKALLRKLTSVESLDGHATVLHNSHEGHLFKSSASDSSITTKASIISVDSIVSSSDCELRVLKSSRSLNDDNNPQLSPVSEV